MLSLIADDMVEVDAVIAPLNSASLVGEVFVTSFRSGSGCAGARLLQRRLAYGAQRLNLAAVGIHHTPPAARRRGGRSTWPRPGHGHESFATGQRAVGDPLSRDFQMMLDDGQMRVWNPADAQRNDDGEVLQ